MNSINRLVTTETLPHKVESEITDLIPFKPLAMPLTDAPDQASLAAKQARLLELQELRRLREAEEDRLRAISQLVMGLAHELNTPLEIIGHAAELVARDGNDDIRETAELIRNNATRASRLIRRLRSLSVTETADSIQPVDVVSAVSDAIMLYRRMSDHDPKLDIRVIDELDADDETLWQGYPQYFTDVLLNLLANAEHHAYRDAGGPVEIRLTRRGDRLHVAVVDHGVGIMESDLDSVLHPFFTTGRSRGRAGLGMSVVYNLVTNGMQGRLHIDSRVGVGTRVLLDLPWRPAS